MNASWGQRLGNGVAIVTLLTAAGAVYALRFRHEPAPRANMTAEKPGFCLGVVRNNGPVVAPTDPSPAVIARYARDGHGIVPFSRCGQMEGGRATAKAGSTLLLVDSGGELARSPRE